MAASAPRGDNPSQSSTPRSSRAIRGAVHRALKTLTTPLLPADIVGLFDPLAGRELRGRVEAVSQHGELTTLKITPSRGTPLSFRPGQFIGLGVQIDGRWQWRCFSITNAPRPNLSSVTLGIKQVPDGAVSTHIATVARVGDIIRLSQPGGEFYLSHPVPNKMFFLTAGSGITPVISMLRWLKQEYAGEGISIRHIHSERGPLTPEPFATELGALNTVLPGYEMQHWDSSSRGRIDPRELANLVPDIAERECFACGPGPLLDDMKKHFPGTRVERFSTRDSTGSAAGGNIYFSDRQDPVACDSSTSILEAAEGAGVGLTHGCRMGICHTCTATVLDGLVVDARTGQSHREGERVRTCCSIPDGDVRITQG